MQDEVTAVFEHRCPASRAQFDACECLYYQSFCRYKVVMLFILIRVCPYYRVYVLNG